MVGKELDDQTRVWMGMVRTMVFWFWLFWKNARIFFSRFEPPLLLMCPARVKTHVHARVSIYAYACACVHLWHCRCVYAALVDVHVHSLAACA